MLSGFACQHRKNRTGNAVAGSPRYIRQDFLYQDLYQNRSPKERICGLSSEKSIYQDLYQEPFLRVFHRFEQREKKIIKDELDISGTLWYCLWSREVSEWHRENC